MMKEAAAATIGRVDMKYGELVGLFCCLSQ